MPFLIAIGMIYILWRLTRKGHSGELAGRVRILEARVRMLEEQMDWRAMLESGVREVYN